MGIVETALLRAATAAVAPAVKTLLGRRRAKRERETSLIELVGAGVLDDFGLRRAGRRLDDIVDTVGERLRSLDRRDGPPLPDNEVAAAFDAVADTLGAADLSDEALFADDLDPIAMAARVRRQLPDVPDRAGLSDAGTRLYRRALDEACVCLTQLLLQLGPFRARAAAEILGRLTEAADGFAEMLARLPVTTLDAPAGTDHDAAFEARYLGYVLTGLDQLELFGVDVHRYRMRTPLSIAYISLAVSGGASRAPRAGGWNPGMLRQEGDGESASVRAEQALGSAERILIRGDAGSGKTTLLQWIAVTAARHGFTGELEAWNGRTPFLVRLRDHVRQRLPAPERFLDATAATIAGLMPAGWVHRRLDAGAVLLVDGVDEVPDTQRREVRDWLHGLLSAYPDLRAVVTSRPAAASARWLHAEGFTPVFLERMGPADIRALIRHWHEAVRHGGDLPCEPHRLAGYEQRLLAQLDGSAHLQNLAAGPLLCAMLCALNLDRDSNLPRNRMDIYQAAVDMLLHRRDAQRRVPTEIPELTSRDQLQLLQQVAWWLTLNGRTELNRGEAEDQLGRRLAGMRHVTAAGADVLNHMIQRSGVLREPVPGRIDFVHRTFQEYMAAREAADQGHTGALLEHAHLDTWRETIILAAGHAHAPVRRELLAGLLDRAGQQPKRARKLRLLAAACLETAPAVEPELLAKIRSHLRELVPRSIAEARSLAAVGEPLLTELPADVRGLTESQAAATVRAAALVNGPAGLATLARYAVDGRPRVQRQLVQDWEYFDPGEYAERVLADAPLDEGAVVVRNPVLLPELSRLRHLTRTSVITQQKLDLAKLDGVPHLDTLSSPRPPDGGLEALAAHRELEMVGLSVAGRKLDLAVLEQLPALSRLYLFGLAPDQDLSSLARLPSLRTLSFHGAPMVVDIIEGLTGLTDLSVPFSEPWRPCILHRLAELESLGLHEPVAPIGGLDALVHELRSKKHLEGLHLYTAAWVTDAAPLARLATLRRLDIDATSIVDLTPLAELARLEWLYIGNRERVLDLGPLAALPRLVDLYIADSPPGLDLTPLRGRRTVVHVARKVELGPRPDGVRLKRF